MLPKSLRLKNLFLIFLVTAFLLSDFPFLLRHSLADETLDNLQKERLRIEGIIKDDQTKINRLSNEINLMESRVNLTIIKIREAEVTIKLREEEILRLTGDIGLVGGKIDLLGKTLDDQKTVFTNRLVAAYKNGQGSYLNLFLGSDNFSSFISRLKYLKVFEQNDNKFLRQMEDTRRVFQTQKIILADKKDQVEQIKQQIDAQRKKLVSYKKDLDQQKKEKQSLLSLTLNDEGKYQQLLTQILAEIESVARSLHGGIKIGEVKKGDIIAREGNSGCVLPSPNSANPVAGAHLHFGVYKDGVAVDPKAFLDRGDLGWPENPTYVTQNFGENYDFYMRNFGIPGHNAMDMSHGYGTPIYAAADGVAYLTGDSRQYGSWCNGKARGIRLEQTDGFVSIYWHII